MTKNDILRRIRYTFDFRDTKIQKIFSLADHDASLEQISAWMKKDDDDDFKVMKDVELAVFLNGFINIKRGKKEGEQPVPEKELTNNLILRKLKIALNLKDTDMLEILELANFRMSKHELSAFFRKPGHTHYKECKDQILRNFLNGMRMKYRGKEKQN